MEEYWKEPTDAKLSELTVHIPNSKDMKWTNQTVMEELKPKVDALLKYNPGASILESKENPGKYLIWRNPEPLAWCDLTEVSWSMPTEKWFW